ncbi:TonB-dependent receptor plug domain-containing protein [Dankookia sp. P2]|uniref:TonB-dependent receptor plug domain-containing protein n=1 Tax=Dankookia sp. P2 TaxID=3423955 RepID=UPI003D67D2E5
MPREALAARPIARTAEALEAAPGLVVTQHSGEGKANQYFLRGFNLDHGTDLAIMLDGMPVNMRTHAHGQGYADLNFLIPELLAGMRVRKGPTMPMTAISPTPARCGWTCWMRWSAPSCRARSAASVTGAASPPARRTSAPARCWRPARSPPIRAPGATVTTCAG